MMVLTTHVAFYTAAIQWPGVGPVLARLDFGVPLFFVISGFLLFRPWAEAAAGHSARPLLRTYLKRRWARIFPAYWIMLTAAILLNQESRESGAATWLQFASLTQIYSDPNALPGLTHIWSLSVEVGFYAILPALGWSVMRWWRSPHKLLWFVVALAAVGWAFRLVALGPLSETTAGYWLPSYLDWFALGMGAAVARTALSVEPIPRFALRLRLIASDTWTSVLVGALLFTVSCTPVGGPLTFTPATPWESVVKHALFGGAAFFLLLPVLMDDRRTAVTRAMTSRPMRVVGRISYGLFLWHLLLMELIARLAGVPLFGGGFGRLWALTVMAALVVAWLSWVLVERPFQRWSHQSSATARTTTSATRAPKAAATSTGAGAD